MIYSTRRSSSLLLLLLALALAAAGCGSTASEPSQPATNGLERTDITMRFQWIPQWQFAGYIAAKVRGYYDEAGLNVTLQGGGPDFPAKQLVASGSEQFGTAWVDSMYLSQQRGVPLVALMTIFQSSPTLYMVHADSDIEGPEDFAGQTVAVYPGGGVETEYLALLDVVGIEREQINEVPGQFSLEPFIQRRLDVLPVYATDQPYRVQQRDVDFRLIDARDYGVELMGDVLFATADFIDQNPNTVRAFVHASLRGWEWALAHPEESVELIADYNPDLDTGHLAFEAQQTIPLVTYGAGERCVGWNDWAAWEAEEQLLLEMGILEEPVPFEQAADNTFVAEYYAAQGIDCTAE
jgi:ABC-type nitrate/sulfonate/bicarbonate transport system substrate-binding protein